MSERQEKSSAIMPFPGIVCGEREESDIAVRLNRSPSVSSSGHPDIFCHSLSYDFLTMAGLGPVWRFSNAS